MTGKESVIETDENKGTEIHKKEEPPTQEQVNPTL